MTTAAGVPLKSMLLVEFYVWQATRGQTSSSLFFMATKFFTLDYRLSYVSDIYQPQLELLFVQNYSLRRLEQLFVAAPLAF